MFTSSSTLKSDYVNGKNQVKNATKDISKEFRNFLGDLEDLVKETSSASGEDLAKAKAKLNARIAAARNSVEDASETIAEQARKTAKVADDYVHKQPWVAIGAGVAVSLLLGYFFSRRD